MSINFGEGELELHNVVIPADSYTPLSVQINSLAQSEYGVGDRDVSYFFNLSLPLIPQNPELQITVPPELRFSAIKFEMSFYGTVQNIRFFQASNLIIFNLVYPLTKVPKGFMFLKL